jgi:signal transduction histidine kinase
LRRLVGAFAFAVGVLAVLTDPGSATDLILVALPVGAFAVWALVPRVPLWAVAVAVVIPVAIAQRDGQLEPLTFEASLLGFVAGRWASPLALSAMLAAFATLAPVAASLLQDPPETAVGIWVVGIIFPWVLGLAAARQSQLASELDASRRELAQQALIEERRRISRDVHDLVGHGLAAVMLQITSARHVLRRDPAAAEEALRSAEEVGRRNMQELRRTVALLRSEDEAGVAPPLPSAAEIGTLVDNARAGGLAVELRTRGDPSGVAPGVGVAIYRIAQEALANAAQHAPHARTVLLLEVADGRASLVAETIGPTAGPTAGPERPRYGLIGMRERATAIGGEFAAGPTSEGWRLSCKVPLRAPGDEAPAGRPGAP